MINIPICNFPGSNHLLFGANVPPLVYYSHLPIIILALVFAFFILFQNRTALPNNILFFTLTTFAAWVFLDSIFWASNRSDVIMLVWSQIILIEPIVYIGCLYLLYVLINEKDVTFWWKVGFGSIYIPIALFAPTSFNLSAFDTASCLALEGPLALYYSYALEFVIVGTILCFSSQKYFHTKDKIRKSRIFTITIGILLFLFAFSWGNITGSFTDDWQLGQFGLFGMPIFIGFLVYSIVRFEVFNIKLIGSVALVFALAMLNFSLLFVGDIQVFRGIAFTTFIASVIFGALLIRSVKREIQQREKIEKLAGELKEANTQLHELDHQKDTVLHMVAHQFKGPIATTNFITELLLDGTYGQLTPEQKENINSIRSATLSMKDQSEMVLAAAQITLGKKLPIESAPLDLNVFFKDAITGAMIQARSRKVELKTSIPAKLPTVMLDRKFTQIAVDNLLSNALKYTALKMPGGGGTVDLSVSVEGNTLHCIVKDTGVGVPENEKDKIFKELSRASNAGKEGTGLGLHVAKGAIESQGGKMWFTSEEGKGTTFFFDLPLKEAPKA